MQSKTGKRIALAGVAAAAFVGVQVVVALNRAIVGFTCTEGTEVSDVLVDGSGLLRDAGRNVMIVPFFKGQHEFRAKINGISVTRKVDLQHDVIVRFESQPTPRIEISRS